MELAESIIRYQHRMGVARISLALSQTHNALDLEAVKQFHAYLTEAIDNPNCRVLVISAEGSDFCRGQDLTKAFAEGQRPDTQAFKLFAECLWLIHAGRLPVIACVEGQVTAGGVGLAAACDFVLATTQVTFIVSEVVVGLVPFLIMPYLIRRVGSSRAKYLTLSSRSHTAAEAHGLGLVDELVQGDMSQNLKVQIQRLLCSSPQAIAETKRYVVQLDESAWLKQNQLAFDVACRWVAQPEVLEGARTFVEGFAPPWFQRYKILD